MTPADLHIVSRFRRRETAKTLSAAFVLVGIVLILAGQIMANSARLNDNDRTQKERDRQTQTLIDKTDTQTKLLTDQNSLIICLLQLASGGNFTDKQECQQKAAQAQQQLLSGQTIQVPQTRPNSVSNPAPTPTPTTPRQCTINLVICL